MTKYSTEGPNLTIRLNNKCNIYSVLHINVDIVGRVTIMRSYGYFPSYGLVIWSRIFGHQSFFYSVVRFRSNGPTS